MSDADPLRVGLTGNIGAGKSTVAAWMRDHGLAVLDADAIAHELLREPGATRDRVVAAFGDLVTHPDGAVDRAALGRRVFSDTTARERLEAILHPAIRAREDELAAELASGGHPIVVTEAALLIETGGADRYHRLVVVSAPEQVRIERLRERGLSTEQARSRMAAQLDDETKRAHGDYVIEGHGPSERSRDSTLVVCRSLEQDLDRLRRGESFRPRASR